MRSVNDGKRCLGMIEYYCKSYSIVEGIDKVIESHKRI